MQPFSLKSNTIGIIIATLLSIRGRRKKSLSPTGAVTAWMVGYLSIACGNRGFLLLLFYQLGTMATKYKKELKVKKDGDASKSSVRSPYQVLACSGIAVVISLVHVCSYGEEKAIGKYYCYVLLCTSIVAHISCSCTHLHVILMKTYCQLTIFIYRFQCITHGISSRMCHHSTLLYMLR